MNNNNDINNNNINNNIDNIKLEESDENNAVEESTNTIGFEESDEIIKIVINFTQKTVEINGQVYTENELPSLNLNNLNNTTQELTVILPSIDIKEEDYLNLVKSNGCLLGYIPLDPNTEFFTNLVTTAVLNNGIALKYVPTKYRTQELCIVAVKSNPRALQYVPDEYKIDGLVQYALEKNPWVLEFIKDKSKYINYVVQQPGLLKYFTDAQNYDDILTQALQKNGFAIKYVDKKLIDVTHYIAVLSQSFKLEAFLPDPYTTKITKKLIEQSLKCQEKTEKN